MISQLTLRRVPAHAGFGPSASAVVADQHYRVHARVDLVQSPEKAAGGGRIEPLFNPHLDPAAEAGADSVERLARALRGGAQHESRCTPLPSQVLGNRLRRTTPACS